MKKKLSFSLKMKRRFSWCCVVLIGCIGMTGCADEKMTRDNQSDSTLSVSRLDSFFY